MAFTYLLPHEYGHYLVDIALAEDDLREREQRTDDGATTCSSLSRIGGMVLCAWASTSVPHWLA
jgi:hypothetical protein